MSTAEYIAEQCRAMHKQIPPKNLTCSVDIQTDCHYINSFIDASFVFMKNGKLDYMSYKVTYLPYFHTGANIINQIRPIRAELGINICNFRSTDSAANMNNAFQIFHHVHCSAHKLNTVIRTCK